MSRLLSYTEISTALECFAQWDFTYGGHRTGGVTLKPRESAPRLRAGSAWGAAVAAWHASHGGFPILGEYAAHGALWESLRADADKAATKGFPIADETLIAEQERVGAVLDHHMRTAPQLPGLTKLEGELNIPIPSRTGKRGSSRYRFHCYLDGHTVEHGHPWIVEFKYRDGLTPSNTIRRQPQYRWYAVAYALTYGLMDRPVGVYVDETLSTPPQPARIVNAKRKGEGINGKTVSHALNQITTPELYVAACEKYGVEPEPVAVETFGQRQWHQRVDLIFTPDELAEGARELVTAAQIIRDLDSGHFAPIRNGKQSTCNRCKFSGICLDPTNSYLIDSVYTRTEPKRLRGPKPEGVR